MTGRPLVFEAEISPGMRADDFVRLATLTESACFDRLGISDVVLWPDVYVLQTLAIQATERIGIGSMVTNPYTRHPAAHAAALAVLQDMSGGRCYFGIGVGAGLEEIGLDYTRPLQTLRECIAIIGGLLSGEVVEFHGEVFDVGPASLFVPPQHPVPVVIGTRSPLITRLAGEVADIALVGARYLTPDLADTYRRWLAEGAARAGRPIDDVEIAPRVTLCISEDGDAARTSVKRYAAHFLDVLGEDVIPVGAQRRTEIKGALGRSTGWYFDSERHDDPELERLIDDELVAASAIAGTPSECVGQVERVLQLGFGTVSCNLVAVRREGQSMADGLAETLLGSKAMLAQIRSRARERAVTHA